MAKLIKGIPDIELFEHGHSGCLGCGEAVAIRLVMKAAGPETIVCEATGCPEVYSTLYPTSSWKVPWIHVAFENAAAVASGVIEAVKKQGRKEKVLVFGGDGGTFDIGLQALSGALERGHDFLYICLENSAYMNTGIQRSGATPKFANTTTSPVGTKIRGKMEFEKPMPFIVAAHRIPYVATASISRPIDLIEKVKKGLNGKGPAYIQISCPCIPGWKIDPSHTIKLSELEISTNFKPLYEIENGVVKINFKPQNKTKVEELLKLQGRFKHLNPQEIDEIQKHVDESFLKLSKIEEANVVL
jgi:pyruvate ferredoxin oxidoreductase beta subunit